MYHFIEMPAINCKNTLFTFWRIYFFPPSDVAAIIEKLYESDVPPIILVGHR